MQKVLRTIALLPLIACAYAGGGAWQKYTTPDKLFSVSFPVKPTVFKKQMESNGYKIPTYFAGVATPKKALLTMRMDISQFPQAVGRMNRLLDLGLNHLVSKKKGLVVHANDAFRIGRYEGRHLVASEPKMEYQLYMIPVGEEVILLMTAGQPGDSSNSDAQKFIASFKIN